MKKIVFSLVAAIGLIIAACEKEDLFMCSIAEMYVKEVGETSATLAAIVNCSDYTVVEEMMFAVGRTGSDKYEWYSADKGRFISTHVTELEPDTEYNYYVLVRANGESWRLPESRFTTLEESEAPSLELSVQSLSFTNREESLSFDIRANCDWRIEVSYRSDINWLEVAPTEGSGNARISVSATENSSDAVREATISVIALHPALEDMTASTIKVTQSSDSTDEGDNDDSTDEDGDDDNTDEEGDGDNTDEEGDDDNTDEGGNDDSTDEGGNDDNTDEEGDDDSTDEGGNDDNTDEGGNDTDEGGNDTDEGNDDTDEGGDDTDEGGNDTDEGGDDNTDEGGNDDVPVDTKTISEILSLGKGATIDGTIEAIVVSNRDLNNLTSKKGMYVQDATGALQFYLASNHEYAFGTKLRIDLTGSKLGEYNGAVQISNFALDKISVVSTNNSVTPKQVSITDFLANKYEGEYIAIDGVQVADNDLSKSWVVNNSHTSIKIEDEYGNTFVVFSSKYATFGAESVAQGSGTIKGIASINNGNIQIIFAQKSDYAGLTGKRFGEQVDEDNDDNDKDDSDNDDNTSSGKRYRSGWYELPTEADLNGDGRDDNNSTLYYAHHLCAGSEQNAQRSGKARNYSVCFSSEHHCPVWVAAPRHSMYRGSSGRTEAYGKDPDIPADIQYSSKQTGGGCNKGHMVGSAERTSSSATNKQVFYYTNIAPQYSDTFNTGGGAWNNLEDHIDGLVCADTLYEVVGCYFEQYTDAYGNMGEPAKISFGGRSDVSRPTMFYYALLRTKKGNSGKSVKNCSASELQCAAFVICHEQSKGHKPESRDIISIEELEALTGFSYFDNVPNAPKSVVVPADWL